MILGFVKKLIALPQWAKILLFSASTILPVYFSAFLSVFISQAINAEDKSVWVHVCILVIISIGLVTIYKVLQNGYNLILVEITKKNEIILYAHSLTQRFITLKQEFYNNRPDKMNDLEAIAQQSAENIKNLIESLYNLFESKYGESNELENRINFEVTFMANSYIDGNITIPAYANRPKRAPVSMSFRESKSDIYDNTVTAMIYREARAHLHIVESTISSQETYHELYADQKSRIKSSIIFPILSPLNKVLATMVVHCDRESFFKKRERRFWDELLEIFSKHIALEKIKLDFIADRHSIKLF